jgi:hypothetical protein
LILGAGVFPGLSTLLAAHALQQVPGSRALDLGIRWSLLSGAGRGTCRLMTRFLSDPGLVLDGGKQAPRPPLGAIERLPFPSGRKAAIECGFPEPVLFEGSVDRLRVFASFSPDLPTPLLRATASRPVLGLLGSGVARPLLETWFRFLRGVVFARRGTFVEFSATARTDNSAQTLTARVEDGMATAGGVIGCLVDALARQRPAAGWQPIHRVIGFEETMAALKARGLGCSSGGT